MAKKTTVESAQENLVSAFEDFLAAVTAAAGDTGKVTKSSKKSEPEEDEDDEEEETEPLNREEVEAMKIGELRTLAKEYLGDDAPTKKADILDALEEFFEDEDGEDEEEDEDEIEDDEDEDGDEELSRDDLEEMDLKELRKVAKDEGHSAADIKGLDQDALIDLILGEGDEDDEDEEDEEEEGEDDVEELDEDALAAMSHKELISLAKELEIKVPKTLLKSTKANQKKLVEVILDSGDDDE